MWSPDTYFETLHFAALAHGAQKFPGQPFSYLVHVTTVTMEVIAALPTSPQLDGDLAVQCALLHDTLEDTETTYQQLSDTFGAAVADGVQALSKDPRKAKGEQLLDSLTRIQAQPHEVWAVKLADRISNLKRPPPYWDLPKISAYQQEARLIYDMLHAGHAALAVRLLRKIEDYSKFVHATA